MDSQYLSQEGLLHVESRLFLAYLLKLRFDVLTRHRGKLGEYVALTGHRMSVSQLVP